jgi:hypothetical protein
MYICDISCCNSGDNAIPCGNDGSGSPPGSTIDGACCNGVPGGQVSPGANNTPGGGPPGGGGGAGKSVAWSARRTAPDATVVSPEACCAAAKSANIAMAAAPAKITCPRRRCWRRAAAGLIACRWWCVVIH